MNEKKRMNRGIPVFASLMAVMGAISPDPAQAAKPKLQIQSTFSYTTNLGYIGNAQVDIDGLTVKVDGASLSAENAYAAKNALVSALSIRPPSKKGLQRRCDAGQYVHRVKRDGKTLVEDGCMTEARFKQLEQAFAFLRALK